MAINNSSKDSKQSRPPIQDYEKMSVEEFRKLRKRQGGFYGTSGEFIATCKPKPKTERLDGSKANHKFVWTGEISPKMRRTLERKHGTGFSDLTVSFTENSKKDLNTSGSAPIGGADVYYPPYKRAKVIK